MDNSQGSRVEGLIEEGEAFRRLALEPTRSQARPSRRFHTGMSVAFLLTAFAGFAPTYYLKPLTSAPLLTPALHIHGALFTAWLLLLLVQSTLVAKARVGLHKKLGITGAIVAAAMVPLGMTTAVTAARHGASRGGLDPHAFMIFPLGQMLLFAVFIGAALWSRRDPEKHRRLVVVATACLMAPAITRLPLIGQQPIVALALSALFVLAGVIHDWRENGRVHRAYVVGMLALLLSGPVRFGVSQTPGWQSFARFVVG